MLVGRVRTQLPLLKFWNGKLERPAIPSWGKPSAKIRTSFPLGENRPPKSGRRSLLGKTVRRNPGVVPSWGKLSAEIRASFPLGENRPPKSGRHSLLGKTVRRNPGVVPSWGKLSAEIRASFPLGENRPAFGDRFSLSGNFVPRRVRRITNCLIFRELREGSAWGPSSQILS